MLTVLSIPPAADTFLLGLPEDTVLHISYLALLVPHLKSSVHALDHGGRDAIF
jgi:hypothetical protein